jgi:hypothetical protein
MTDNAALVIAQCVALGVLALAVFGWAISIGMQVLNFILDLVF